MSGAAEQWPWIAQAPPRRGLRESIASVYLSHASWGGIWSIGALQEGASPNYLRRNRSRLVVRSSPAMPVAGESATGCCPNILRQRSSLHDHYRTISPSRLPSAGARQRRATTAPAAFSWHATRD